MSFFKKLGGVGNSLFKKQVMPNVQSIFKKGGAGRKFSNFTGELANLTGVAGRELRRGATNPVLEGIGNFTIGADKTKALQGAALAGSGALRGASGVLRQASDLTNIKNLRGNPNQVASNVLERSKNLKQDTQALFA